MSKTIRTICLFLLFIGSQALASDLPQAYVGQSGCAPELKSSLGRYGIRLDKSQHTRLEAHVFKTKTILTIVQYKDDSDRCGTVRDVIQSIAKSSFVWRCTDRRNPNDVVVGTWPSNYAKTSGPSAESWRVDLSRLGFVRLDDPVVCDSGNYAGSDGGEDLAGWARQKTKEITSPSVPEK